MEALSKLGPEPISDKERRRRRFAGGIAKRAIEHYEEKYGKNPALAKNLVAQHFNMEKVISEQDAELEDLFESIAEEIEERQLHLESLGEAADKKIKDRIKTEICERIAELQRIRELQNKL